MALTLANAAAAASLCLTLQNAIVHAHAQEVAIPAVPTIKVKRVADNAEGPEGLSALLNPRQDTDKDDIMVSYDITSNAFGHTKREPVFDAETALLERGRDRKSRRTNDPDQDNEFKKPGEAEDVCSLDFGDCHDPTLSHREVMSNGGDKRRTDLYEATDKKLKAKSGNAERAGMEICKELDTHCGASPKTVEACTEAANYAGYFQGKQAAEAFNKYLGFPESGDRCEEERTTVTVTETPKSTVTVHKTETAESHEPKTTTSYEKTVTVTHVPSTTSAHEKTKTVTHTPTTTSSHEKTKTVTHMPTTTSSHKKTKSIIHMPTTTSSCKGKTVTVVEPTTVHVSGTMTSHLTTTSSCFEEMTTPTSSECEKTVTVFEPTTSHAPTTTTSHEPSTTSGSCKTKTITVAHPKSTHKTRTTMSHHASSTITHEHEPSTTCQSDHDDHHDHETAHETHTTMSHHASSTITHEHEPTTTCQSDHDDHHDHETAHETHTTMSHRSSTTGHHASSTTMHKHKPTTTSHHDHHHHEDETMTTSHAKHTGSNMLPTTTMMTATKCGSCCNDCAPIIVMGGSPCPACNMPTPH